MQNKNISLPISFSVNNEISDKNNRFINVTIDVLHTGLNYNGSIFNKEVVDENIETIKNTPILGFITEVPYDDKDFKGHEYVITKDKNGTKRKYIGEAFGMIPESCNPRWITKTTDSGVEREFLQVDGILWSKFQDAADIMLKDIEKPQSMELYPYDIDGYDDEDGNFVFSHFSFDGCCILGSTVEPAMENAKIEVQFTMSDFVKSIQNELNDKYSAFTKIVGDTNTFTETVNEKTNGGVEIMENTDFAQTLLGQFEDISAQVRQYETFTDRWGYECPRYYAVDVQENEVIVVDAKNNYNYFGLSFTMNGDKAEIDFESAKRKKLRYEDYEDGSSIDGAFDFGKYIEEIQNNAFAKVEDANAKVSEAEGKVSEYEVKVSEAETAKNDIEEKFNQINAEFEEIKPKYDDFVKAEQARINAELDAQKDAEFAKYETVLADDVNFAALKEKKSELTIKEIESECAIMYARKNLAQTNFSKSTEIMTAGLMNDTGKDGFIETKYGYIPVR
jgi:predicted RNase H-like HicB family nuclease